MTFLFQPEQKSHSTFSIAGWKLISSRGMSCRPLSFLSVVEFSAFSCTPGEKKSRLSFNFLNLSWPSTELLSHTLQGSEGWMTLIIIHFVPALLFVSLIECLYVCHPGVTEFSYCPNMSFLYNIKNYLDKSHSQSRKTIKCKKYVVFFSGNGIFEWTLLHSRI